MTPTARPSPALRLVARERRPDADGRGGGIPGGTARPRLFLVADDASRRQLLRTIEFALAVRRHAAARLRCKAMAARATAAILTGVLGLYAAIGIAAVDMPSLPSPARPVVAILLMAIAALLAAMRSQVCRYQPAIQDLERCIAALQANRSRMLASATMAHAELVEARRRHVDALQACDARHSHTDYLAARLSTGRTASPWRWRTAFVTDVLVIPATLIAMPMISWL